MTPPAAVLTPRTDDFPRWYQDVVAKAELAENGPVRGTMVIRPYGYAIWELLQGELDRRIKALGAHNAYFPLFIPQSYLRREAEHVEGFSPELAVVTHGGGKELEEPVVVRPTSETIVNASFARWIHSHRDLPMLVNQWANVVRWELRPRLFLRTTEFLWQEGHTAHVSEADAAQLARRALVEVYLDAMTSVMAIPVLTGRKTEAERFAGASTTWTCEGMMGDGKALQMATSHELGQNFARAFDITFSDETGAQRFVWQTSWGASTRLMGALIMAHGDDRGLRLPPRLAPVQVVVVVARADPAVLAEAHRLGALLDAAGLRIQVDDQTEVSFGRRVVDWEIKGAPVRVEIGPRDLAEGRAVVVRRDRGEKVALSLDRVVASVSEVLDDIHTSLLAEADRRRRACTRDVDSIEDAIEAAATGFGVVPAPTVDGEGERRLQGAGVSVRCLQRRDGSLPEQGDPLAELVAVVARAY